MKNYFGKLYFLCVFEMTLLVKKLSVTYTRYNYDFHVGTDFINRDPPVSSSLAIQLSVYGYVNNSMLEWSACENSALILSFQLVTSSQNDSDVV